MSGKKPKRKKAAAVVRFGDAVAKVYRREDDGRYSVNWREAGKRKSTTRATLKEAKEFAEAKVEQIDSRQGMRWVSPAVADAVAAVRRAFPKREVAAVIAEAAEAGQLLGDCEASLMEAARYFVEQGPAGVKRVFLSEAVARFVERPKYEAGSQLTIKHMRGEFEAFLESVGDVVLAELTVSQLEEWVRRGEVKPRTVWGRIGDWRTLLNWCRAEGWLPHGRPHAAERIDKPRLPDETPKILTVEQGAQLMAAAVKEDRRLLPFLVLAGWAGLRPSECQRLEWKDVDEGGGFIHVRAAVARKTSQERFVPMVPGMRRVWRMLRKEPRARQRRAERVCPYRSREWLSQLAREKGVLEVWPADVLRHSFCSYRLAVTQNVGQVAEEAGNSPAVVRRNYRKPVKPAEGKGGLRCCAG